MDFKPFPVSMSKGQVTVPLDSDGLVAKLRGENSISCNTDVQCSQGAEGHLTSTTFTLSLTNDNLPVLLNGRPPDTTTPPPPPPHTSPSSTAPATQVTTSSTDPSSSAASSETNATSTSTSQSSAYSHTYNGPTSLGAFPSYMNPAPSDSSSLAGGSADGSVPTAGTAVSPSTAKSSHIGAIVGGVVGGVIGLLLLLALILFILKRRRRGRYDDDDIRSSGVFGPSRRSVPRGWSNEADFTSGHAEEKILVVAATPDGGAAYHNDSHPSYKELLGGMDEQGYPTDKDPARWGTPVDLAPAYRRASFQTDDGASSLHSADRMDRSDSPGPTWDPNRFVRSPSPH